MACTYFFSVAGVPTGEKFYGVEVSHRGVVQYSGEEIREPLTLSLS